MFCWEINLLCVFGVDGVEHYGVEYVDVTRWGVWTYTNYFFMRSFAFSSLNDAKNANFVFFY